MRLAGLVLAAGEARRFGAIKQLAPLDGRPLLEHAIAAAVGAPALARVIVALGAHAEQIAGGVDLRGAQALVVPDWAEGQAASLRAGVALLAAEADAVVVTLGDQPWIASATIERVAAAAEGPAAAVRATFGSRPGHPVLLKRSLFPAVAVLRGDAGARGLLEHVEVQSVECGPDVVFDVDTPAQLAAARRMSR